MLHHLRHAPLLHHLHPRFSSSLSFSSKYLLILSNSSSSLVHRLVHNSSSRGIVRFRPGALCTTTGERAELHGGEEDGFFANDGVTWKSLGISDRVAQALTNTGFHGPSLVQAACIPHILRGHDVVVATETGSGKTHSYLVPLIHKLGTALAPSENELTHDSLEKSRDNSGTLPKCDAM